MSVPFTELSGSPEEKWSMAGFSATRKLLCVWEARNALIRELLGDNEEFAGATAASYPGRSDIRVTDVNVVPWEKSPDSEEFTDVANQMNTYTGQLAQLTVGYQWMIAGSGALPNPRSMDVEPDTFLTYNRKIGGEYVTLPGRHIQWSDDPDIPVPKDALPTLRIPITEHHFTWNRVTRPPETAMANVAGKINATKWAGYSAETMLFDGGTMKREFVGFPENDPVAGGQGSWGTWEVNYVFRQKVMGNNFSNFNEAIGEVFGWQHTWRVDGDFSGYGRLESPNGKGLYREASNAELDALFKNEVV
jgi:hypothetical protein